MISGGTSVLYLAATGQVVKACIATGIFYGTGEVFSALHNKMENLDPGGPLAEMTDVIALVGIGAGIKLMNNFFLKSGTNGATPEYLGYKVSEKVKSDILAIYKQNSKNTVIELGNGAYRIKGPNGERILRFIDKEPPSEYLSEKPPIGIKPVKPSAVCEEGTGNNPTISQKSCDCIQRNTDVTIRYQKEGKIVEEQVRDLNELYNKWQANPHMELYSSSFSEGYVKIQGITRSIVSEQEYIYFKIRDASGREIVTIVNPDHEVQMSDGTFKPAKDLKIKDFVATTKVSKPMIVDVGTQKIKECYKYDIKTCSNSPYALDKNGPILRNPSEINAIPEVTSNILIDSNLIKFIKRIRGSLSNQQLENVATYIPEAIQKLNRGESFRYPHTVTNDNGVNFLAINANELNIGGSGGRGDWRYIFIRNSRGEYEFKGLARHRNSGGHDFYYY